MHAVCLFVCFVVDVVATGEFGVVYRGHLTGWKERVTAELVAIKTLKSEHKENKTIFNFSLFRLLFTTRRK